MEESTVPKPPLCRCVKKRCWGHVFSSDRSNYAARMAVGGKQRTKASLVSMRKEKVLGARFQQRPQQLCCEDGSRRKAPYQSLPCVKGGGIAEDDDGGIVMQPKHNKGLVPMARELRKDMTKEERHLWYDFLQKYPIRFSRQKVLGKYIADFYSAEAKLVIELDGSQHYENESLKKDAERTAFLEAYGLKVIRIPNNEINGNFKAVCEYIDEAVKQSLSQPDG